MKFNKLIAVLLVFGLIFSGPVIVLAEGELTNISTCPETGCVEETTTTTTNSTIAYNPFINSISPDTGISDSDHITKNNIPTFSGGSTFISESITLNYYPIFCDSFLPTSTIGGCTISSESTTMVTTDENGNWNATFSSPIKDGEYVALATYGSNQYYSNKFYFTIDTQAPEIENAYLYNGAAMNIDFSIFDNKNVNTNNLTIAVNFLNQDFFKSKIYVLDMFKADGLSGQSDLENIWYSQEFNSNDSVNFYLASLNLIDSSYRVIVTAEDAAGNEIWFGYKTFTFNIDTTAPEAPVIVAPVSGTHDKNEPIQITGTCTPGMTVWFEPRENMAYDSVTDCLDDGTFSFTFNLNVIHDEFPGVTLPITLSARQKDGALNLSEKSNEVTLTEEAASSSGGSTGNTEVVKRVQNSGGGVVGLEFLKNPISNIVSINNNSNLKSTTSENTGKVLGASTSCPNFTKYIKLGANNDRDEVKKWQTFLNETQGENLDVDGIYGPLTFAAVNRFQEKYSNEVLTPWNTKFATGFIYITTTKMGNKLLGC